MKSILVVEDELSIRSFVCLNLRKKNYKIYEAESGEDALALFRAKDIDIVLLDLMLPGIDGYKVCEEIRKISGSVGIIMLTARSQDEDKVKGLIQGADDYIVKPFSMVELDARIISLVRRIEYAQKKEEISTIQIGALQLDQNNKSLIRENIEIKLTPTEYSILYLFMTNKDRIYTRDELLDEIWGVNYVGDLKVVDVNIRRIRTKMESDPSNPEHLKTIWGYGYQWKD